MSDRILQVALATSILGILLLAYASEALEPPYTKIGDVSTSFIGKNVHLQGNASGLHEFKGGSILLKVSELNNTVDVFIPYGVSSQTDLNSVLNKKIDLIGAVEVYEGRIEVVVDKLSNIRLVENAG